MTKNQKYIVFNLDKQQFALPLSCVERVVRMVEINPLAKTPDFIMGVINFHGKYVPVIDFRELFNMPKRDVELSDQLIIAKSKSLTIAIWIDSFTSLTERTEEEIINAGRFLIKNNLIKGLLKLDKGIVLIQDMDGLLSNKEIQDLKEVLKEIKTLKN